MLTRTLLHRPLRSTHNPLANVLGKLLSHPIRLRVQLVIPALVRLERAISALRFKDIEQPPTSMVARQFICVPMPEPHRTGHASREIGQRFSFRQPDQVRSALQHARQPAERARVVVQRVIGPVLLDLQAAADEVRGQSLDHLLVGQELGGEFAGADDEPVRLGGGVEGDVGCFEHEAGDAGAGVDEGLRGGGEHVVQRIGTAHAVAHQEERETLAGRGDGEHEFVDVGLDLGAGAGETFVGGGVDAVTPASLVEGVYLNVVGRGESGEELVVCITVVTGGAQVLVDGGGGGV